MDAAGLGIAVAAICIKSGKKLYTICQAYKTAQHDIRESILCIENVWLKIQSQVEVLAQLWDELDGHVQTNHHHLLSVLDEKLQLAILVLNRLDALASDESSPQGPRSDSRGGLKKLNYAIFTKKKLEGVVHDLETWHRRFDPSWYLLARSTLPTLDQQARIETPQPIKEIAIIQKLRLAHCQNNEPMDGQSSVFLTTQNSISRQTRIEHSSAETGYATDQVFIIDTLLLSDTNHLSTTTKDVRDLARILANVDPTVFGLLVCHGVLRMYEASQITGFKFVFAIPAGLSEPRSLRTILSATDHQYPLDDQFRLARLLARSVSFLHSAQIVHKNISPETILLLRDSESNLGQPFLVGFEKFRYAEGRTYMSGDTLWEKNLYRHPLRQGERPEEEYRMQHDMYSLGVCLLEIGLRISFVLFDAAFISDYNAKSAVPNPLLEISDHLKNKDLRARAFQIKRRLVAMAETQLLSRMGKVYTNVVLFCLTCLDKDNQRFGDQSEFIDKDGILIGVRYIEKILYQLEEVKF